MKNILVMRTEETKTTLILMPAVLHIVRVWACVGIWWRQRSTENIIQLHGVLTVLTEINLQLMYTPHINSLICNRFFHIHARTQSENQYKKSHTKTKVFYFFLSDVHNSCFAYANHSTCYIVSV